MGTKFDAFANSINTGPSPIPVGLQNGENVQIPSSSFVYWLAAWVAANNVNFSFAGNIAAQNLSGTNTGDETPVSLIAKGAQIVYSGTASGTNTYAVTASPVATAYAANLIANVTFTNANTGAATLNLNGLGAQAIQLNGAALVGGEIPAGCTLSLKYDGTQFQIVGSSSTASKLLTARTIAMSGDVVWSVSFDGSGNVAAAGTIQANAVTTSKVANSAITLAKIANASANSKLLGSGAAGSGSPYAELTLGTNLSMSGTTLNATGGGASSPLTTKGDIWTFGSADARQGVGSNGQIIVADSTQTNGWKWVSPSTTGPIGIGVYASAPAVPVVGQMYQPTDVPGLQMVCETAGSWDYFFQSSKITPPNVGSFTQVNWSTSTTAAVGPYTEIVPLTASAYALRVLAISAPSTPYSKEFAFLMPSANYSSLSLLFGAGFRESSSGKMHLLWYDGTGATPLIRGVKFNSATSINATYFSGNFSPFSQVFKGRVRDDGTNRYLDIWNGTSWNNLSSIIRTDFLTADQVCVAVNITGPSIYVDRIAWIHWL